MKEQPNYYAIIPASVRYCNKLSPNEKLLYGEITALANKTGQCWASNGYFSALYGVHKKTISSWVGSLSRSGLIGVKLIYKDGTREVEKRIITLTVKSRIPSPENDGHPHREITEDNSTRKNNTRESISIANIIYSLYPRKAGKGAAIKAIIKALQNFKSPDKLRKIVEEYALAVSNWEDKDKAFVPHCATWMNQERWEDDRSEWNKGEGGEINKNSDWGNMA